MFGHAPEIPVFPAMLTAPLRVAPLAPMGLALTVIARRLIARHPGLIARLGAHGDARFAIDPTDLPLTLLMHPHPTHTQITLHRSPPEAEARIAGPLAGLLGLVHGAYDGDALFFSRDLVIEGDTSAALALRNAIDDAELDLGAEIAMLAGPFRAALAPLIRVAGRVSGIALSRVEGGAT
ncbi:MAG: ubiquinone anaerobic biosynthesis accessory factor UbiT [Alkalilacustris sp.]